MASVRYATHHARGETARKKLLAAARALIAGRGLSGFTMADVARMAGGSRALAGFHFSTRHDLIEACYTELLDHPLAMTDPGLGGLKSWMGERLRLAAGGDPEVLALMQLALDPAAEAAPNRLRTEYLSQRVEFIKTHLERARALRQIDEAYDPDLLAPLLLALLHGEMKRITNVRMASGKDFLALLENGLLARPAQTRPPRGQKADRPQSTQQGLFR